MAVLLGIDFGTSYCAVSFLHGEEAKLLAPEQESRWDQIPSVFAYDGRPLAGTQALRIAYGDRHSDSVRYIKRSFRDKQCMDLGGRVFHAREVVNEIMGYLLDGAKWSLEHRYHLPAQDLSAVLCTPVNFDPLWKEMLCQALQEHDVVLEAVLSEPLAAAYHNLRNHPGQRERVLVFDLGGGTCDVALIETTGRKDAPFLVLAQESVRSGGTDWDQYVIDLLSEQILSVAKQGPEQDLKRVRQYISSPAIEREASEIKELLSEQAYVEYDIRIRGAQDYRVSIRRDDFEQRSRERLESVMAVAHTVARGRRVDRILLVGGGSRMPQVQNAMHSQFPKSRIELSDPETSVSAGAAEYGARPKTVRERAMQSYGIRSGDGVEIQLQKGALLPAKRCMEWTLRGGIHVFDVYGINGMGNRVPVDQADWIMNVRLRTPSGTETRARQTLSLQKDGWLECTLEADTGSGILRASHSEKLW